MDSRPGTSPPLPIGTLAARTGVSVQAIRYYERRGLIAPVGRRASGYREYAPEAVEAIQFIRQAQRIGFTLEEVGELIRLRRRVATGRSAGADSVRAAVAAKREDVSLRIRQLQSLQATLDGLLDACDRMCQGESRPAECPIFEAIDHADPPGSIAPAGRATGRRGRARPAAPHPHP